MKLSNRYTKTRSKRYMSIFVIAAALVVAAMSATLQDIPDNVDYNNLRGAAKFQAREGLKARE